MSYLERGEMGTSTRYEKHGRYERHVQKKIHVCFGY